LIRLRRQEMSSPARVPSSGVRPLGPAGSHISIAAMPAAALSLSLSVSVVASPCLLLSGRGQGRGARTATDAMSGRATRGDPSERRADPIAPEPIARAVNREGYFLPGKGRGVPGGEWEGVGKTYGWQEGKFEAGRQIEGGKANEKREGKSWGIGFPGSADLPVWG
jgi:hypothetical protein